VKSFYHYLTVEELQACYNKVQNIIERGFMVVGMQQELSLIEEAAEAKGIEL
jgi:hypothetical protein